MKQKDEHHIPENIRGMAIQKFIIIHVKCLPNLISCRILMTSLFFLIIRCGRAA